MLHLIFNLLDSCGGLSHLTENRVQDAAVAVVFNLHRCIKANLRLERRGGPVASVGRDGHPLKRLNIIAEWDAEGFVAGQPQLLFREIHRP